MIINHCLFCSSPISHKRYICAKCTDLLENAEFDKYMSRCNLCSFPKISNEYVCHNCETYPQMKVFSIFDFRNAEAKRFLELYKFKSVKKLSKLFAYYVQKAVSQDEIIVPIPSSNVSLKRRGWDQIKEITKYLNNDTAYLIVNNDTYTKENKTLTKKERIELSKDKFLLANNYLNSDKNAKFVILDDVFTTGSTVNAAFCLLKNAGYTNVRAVTLYAEL